MTASERPGPVARLLGSLANVLIDLGLPAIRQWLRDRLGPTADVGQVTTDGALIHLDSVLVPVGDLGLLQLSRASLTGLPEVRLHAFEGVLLMRSGFRVDVVFGATGPPEPGAWISGDVAVRAAPSWSGRARLVAASREWRLEGGLLESEGGERIRLAATGVFEADDAIPVTTAGVALERARVDALLDTLAAAAGRPIAWPRALFPDARLRGELAWNATDGARVDLWLAADGVGATLSGRMTPSGDALAGEATARIVPARILHPAGAPREAMPRDEDAITFTLGLRGSRVAPEVTGTFHATELGFRFGRPRFVPAVLVRELVGELFVKGGRAVVTATATGRARSGTIAIDADADLRAASIRAATRGAIRADLDAAIARDVLRTLGVHVEVPDDLMASAELVLTPPVTFGGSIRIATARSDVVLEGGRARGRVAVADALTTGLFGGTVRPTSGELAIDLAVTRSGARGTASARELGLSLRDRECVAEDVSVELTILFGPPYRMDYRALRFSAHGGRFLGQGSIPDAPLRLELEQGSIELARTLVPIFAPAAARWTLPEDLGLGGTLDVAKGGATSVDLVLETPGGTALDLRVSPGDIRLRGALAARELGDLAVLRAEGTIALDLALRSEIVTGWLSAERLVFEVDGIEVEATSLAARIRADRERLVMNPVEATIAGGRVVVVAAVPLPWDAEARVHLALAGVLVHDLPPIAGRAPGAIVHGALSAIISGRLARNERPRATGRVRLDRATFPILDRARPTLLRYGLRPPSEDATSPGSATLVSSEWGVTISDVIVDLHGAKLRGSLVISWAGTLDGQGEVTLEEEYLRTSKVLTLPRALTERLVFPIHVDGTLETPHVKADLGNSLGRFLKDNRVASFVTSAVEEAQILLGQHRMPKPSSEPPAPVVIEDEELRGIVDTYAADWLEIARRIRDGK